jgi:hypothetical protein
VKLALGERCEEGRVFGGAHESLTCSPVSESRGLEGRGLEEGGVLPSRSSRGLLRVRVSDCVMEGRRRGV